MTMSEQSDKIWQTKISKKFLDDDERAKRAKGEKSMENVDKIYDLLNSIKVTRENEGYINEIKD